MAKKEYSYDVLIPFDEMIADAFAQRHFDGNDPLDIEIGFGVGEFLVNNALENPQRRYLGIELDWERIYKTLKRVYRSREEFGQGVLANLKIIKFDATIVLGRLIPPKRIDVIYCLFPCPWPKKCHEKYRLFTKEFLRLCNSRLKKNGRLEIVTDHKEYYEWICQRIGRTGFSVDPEEIAPQYNTKFEKKWLALGQQRFYKLTLTKIRHIHVSLAKRVVLRSYSINTFCSEKFVFQDFKERPAIVCKDFLYDPKKEQAVVELIVAEDHLTQNFRVMILRQEKEWCICKAGGQIVFPTPGIAKALQLVYESAKAAKE